MRDALHGWVCDLSIEMNCYTTFYTTQSLDHGLFAFQRRVDAIRFVLEWT